jgi:hypothetical protein
MADGEEYPGAMEWSQTNVSTVQAGFRFPTQRIRLERGSVDAYLTAVEDDDATLQGAGAIVPPLAILAFSMRGLAELLAARPGAVHLTQRLSMRRAVAVGTEVTADLVVQSRSERRGFAALNLSLEVAAAGIAQESDEREIVLEGAMLLMVPLTVKGLGDA